LVVFVDGDFWHGQQWQLRGFRSLENQIKESSSASCWVRKTRRNMERDVVTNHLERRVAEDSLKAQKVADEPETVNACSEAIGPEG
jgi:G:T-mismatch repair DNA endonuclease (very short patch repair protein)